MRQHILIVVIRSASTLLFQFVPPPANTLAVLLRRHQVVHVLILVLLSSSIFLRAWVLSFEIIWIHDKETVEVNAFPWKSVVLLFRALLLFAEIVIIIFVFITISGRWCVLLKAARVRIFSTRTLELVERILTNNSPRILIDLFFMGAWLYLMLFSILSVDKRLIFAQFLLFRCMRPPTLKFYRKKYIAKLRLVKGKIRLNCK